MVIYEQQQRKRKCSGYVGRKITVKPERPCCPISNEGIASSDPRLRYFLVRGKRVAVNVEVFLSRCDRVGWPKPEIKKGDCFDIEPWLADRARELSKLPVGKIRRGLINIAEFARLLGLDIRVVKIVKQAK